MAGMEVLEIPGVTDGMDNDYAAQAEGALRALEKYDLVSLHVEAPDEAAHSGSIDDKVKAIERVDEEVVRRIRSFTRDSIRVLVLPDHPTPIKIQTHTDEPVPFMLWGSGITSNGAKRFTEAEAKARNLFVDEGHNIMRMLIKAI
jgi:2,3-bisphosphoglycerate-independent phosphoglycerate mutase